MSVIKKKWMISPYNSQLQLKISEELNISPVLAQLCINRGMSTIREVENFIGTSPNEVHDPFTFRHMRQAVNLIEDTIKNQEKILIYGDYDVDGVTAASLLYLYIKNRTSSISYYIPDRLEEGYGLNEEAVYWAYREGYKLIITVDCGISSVNETEIAKSLGLNIIITDHHTPPDKLPAAEAIINPKVKDSGYPFLDLAGVGVAWKLAQALEISKGLCNNDHSIVLAEYLDLVSLGTVADVVPLVGENRVIVSLGLKKIVESQRPGIKALLSATGLENKLISTGQVGFILAPRINAVGRLSKGSSAVKLLTGLEYQECLSQANELEQINCQRQEVEGEILEEAIRQIEERVNLAEDFVIVLASENWHPGVIGIVSSRLVEKYYRPVVLLTVEGDLAKGSARSVEEFDIYQAFRHCKELLIQFGGHKMAAGIKLNKENIRLFQKTINDYASAIVNKDLIVPSVKIDLELDTDGAEGKYIEDSERLSPFGSGNAQPVFAYRNLRVVEAKAVGNNQTHLKVVFDTGDYLLDGVGFHLSHHLSWIRPFCKVDVAVSLEKNRWNGCEKIQLVIKDIQPHSGLPEMVPGSNKNVSHIIGEKPVVRELLADFREINNREEYLLNLLKRKETCLIYVSSPRKIEELIQLVSMKGPTNIKIGWCHGYQRPWQHGLVMAKVKNRIFDAVVFTGNLYADTEGLFNHVVFFHSPRNMEQFNRCIYLGSSNSSPKIHLLFNMGDMKAIDWDLKTVFPDRELLGKIYKSVKHLASSTNQIFGSREEIIRRIRIEGLDKGIEKAFDAWVAIMMELGLIKMSSTGNRYRLELINNGNKCNLEDSFCYVEGLKEKKAFELWTEIAFSPRLNEEICALLG